MVAKKKRTRIRLLILTVAIAIGLCAPSLAMPAMAKTKTKLVKQYTLKTYNYETKSWNNNGILKDIIKFKYNKKGDLVQKIGTRYFDDGETMDLSGNPMKYKYKKGKKKTRSEISEISDSSVKVTTYKKGVPVKWTESDDIDLYYHKYKFKARYAYYRYDESYMTEEKQKSTGKFKVTAKKGYPVKIVWKSGGETYTANFNKKGKTKGLPKTITEARDQYQNKYTFKYKIKKGKVTRAEITAVLTDLESNKIEKYKERYDFKYGKKKIGKKRYNSMITDIIAGYHYYIYTYWY